MNAAIKPSYLHVQHAYEQSPAPDMPGMQRVMGGVKPMYLSAEFFEDFTASGIPWAKAIEEITAALVLELDTKFARTSYSYTGMRDQGIGEHDEYRLLACSGQDLLRDQKLANRVGGGDPEETFAQTLQDRLSDAKHPAIRTGAEESQAFFFFCTSDTKPATHNTLQDLGLEVKARKIHLFVIGTPGSNMEELAIAAGGEFFQLSTTPRPEDAQKIAARLTKTVIATVRSEPGTVAAP